MTWQLKVEAKYISDAQLTAAYVAKFHLLDVGGQEMAQSQNYKYTSKSVSWKRVWVSSATHTVKVQGLQFKIKAICLFCASFAFNLDLKSTSKFRH